MDARAAADNRDAFISLVSHELRNPLTTIQGFAALMQRRMPQSATDEVADSLELIAREARRMNSTLQLLVDLARLDAGELAVVDDDVDVVELLQAEVRAFRVRHPDVHLEERYPQDAVVIRSDHDRIAQVIGNLLDNAAKYGGGRVEVAVTRTPESVDLSVRDNGEGISAEDQARIFERFFRGSATGVTDTAGSGLGLYISRQVARRLGADLICESTGGVGSTFTLRLRPLVSGQPSAHRPSVAHGS
jgi:signal transduction histidine kinase